MPIRSRDILRTVFEHAAPAERKQRKERTHSISGAVGPGHFARDDRKEAARNSEGLTQTDDDQQALPDTPEVNRMKVRPAR
jgi:hypothetical protein